MNALGHFIASGSMVLFKDTVLYVCDDPAQAVKFAAELNKTATLFIEHQPTKTNPKETLAPHEQ
jgi:hypothetical protein